MKAVNGKKTVQKVNGEAVKLTAKQKKFFKILEEGIKAGTELYKRGQINVYDKKAFS
jgi:hypothetical protein